MINNWREPAPPLFLSNHPCKLESHKICMPPLNINSYTKKKFSCMINILGLPAGNISNALEYDDDFYNSNILKFHIIKSKYANVSVHKTIPKKRTHYSFHLSTEQYAQLVYHVNTFFTHLQFSFINQHIFLFHNHFLVITGDEFSNLKFQLIHKKSDCKFTLSSQGILNIVKHIGTICEWDNDCKKRNLF